MAPSLPLPVQGQPPTSKRLQGLYIALCLVLEGHDLMACAREVTGLPPPVHRHACNTMQCVLCGP